MYGFLRHPNTAAVFLRTNGKLSTSPFFSSGVNPLIPMINPVHRTIISRRGSNVTLVCLGRNVEVLDTMAVWKFKGREIKDNTNKKATEKWLPGERGNFTLHITNVSQRDVGKYTCSVLVANFNKADAAEGFMKLKLFSSGTFIDNVCFLLIFQWRGKKSQRQRIRTSS